MVPGQPIPPRMRQPKLSTISRLGEFRYAEIDFEGSIMSRREDPLEFEMSERPNSREGKPH